ncbi:fimbrial biogenesis chaperone [Escherichia coli]|uniref:fimbrial biogenesis chaperone n=1 Tax=Escherichia coli TaxID=562 RepID=UPI0006940ECC|nr:molecular chaperone [Escherichia coli]HAZ3798563.1 molecular chaperone [Escherichia coli]
MMKNIIPIIFLVSPFVAHAVEQQRYELNQKQFSVSVGVSRVVVNGDNPVDVPVENRQSYPVLVESFIMDEGNEHKSTNYVATPPLFRLDGGQKTSVSLLKSAVMPSDRETLNWLCVRSVPPSGGEAWIGDDKSKAGKTSLNVNVLVRNCVKIIMRPESIPSVRNGDYGAEVKWSVRNGKLYAENPTPYYINFKSLEVGGKKVGFPVFIPPRGAYEFSNAGSISKGVHITWSLINDYGGESRRFSDNVG